MSDSCGSRDLSRVWHHATIGRGTSKRWVMADLKDDMAWVADLLKAMSREDEWTGTKDAAARRKAQTRLNTRAYRIY
ncbi:hypothetical protein CMEL01_16404 [Colletotrichum melonis]|uniref:Uncharacterized protein n=1 Tax=Colletotrichum melonis TaxID=1209925 RepID=A0AAI9UFL2_9PEZI|nr:hypothetical protein CMEL01_16404 [Colletotrichum melonis]